MREILEKLMVAAGDDAYSLQKKSGVPQPTTQRFLAGKHGDPRSSTVKKWAGVYGVTESQLRGDVPIDGIEVTAKQPAHKKQILTHEQQRILALMSRIDRDARDALLKVGDFLAKPFERRKEDTGHSPERRLGGQKYKDDHDTCGYEEKPPGKPSEQSQKRRKND